MQFSPMATSFLIQGAEAKVYEGTFCGRPAIFKQRFVKTYRLPQLDEHLTKERMKNEARSLLRCRQAGVKVPALYHCNLQKRILVTEKLLGQTLRECLKDLEVDSKYDAIDKLLQKVGEIIGLMHKSHIVHGDLTTSNFITLLLPSTTEEPNVAVIDLGLSGVSEKVEEKAVDLYVLERAFASTHSLLEDRFKEVLVGYRHAMGNKPGGAVLVKLEEVKMRGRKRTMEG
ncbi:TP53-regulating kinase-like isoform X2 [Varroa jacobsoni]|uniref:non-specific serine/threonine protein kinase n=1 Tax=Varroa destructor TaxID=109461 RepID=A0A7M7MJB7_VARDE|nr:TP53-regulating kinase-like isoform X2 [Varroa destructor]XP_022702227.1 TP53-regulating kinase-like isoform X2 [Varroa jacobsoni]